MSLATVLSRAQNGLKAPRVRVEVHVSGGLPAFTIVGLAETAVRESRDRVRAAIQNAGLEFPQRRITVNLAPADFPKEGGRFDLAIAVGILSATAQLPADSASEIEFYGELSLGGELRRVPGLFPALLHSRRDDRRLIVPRDNSAEAALVPGIEVGVAQHLLDVCRTLSGGSALPTPARLDAAAQPAAPDLADVAGQTRARRALEIAAAGGHNLMLIGLPGTGKSMLAARLPGLLPPLSEADALEVAAIASLTRQGFDPRLWRVRPFRSPHHTASTASLVGGGARPRPGEVSLAHRGVLFLDELPEFGRSALEALREPMETGRVCLARAAHRAEFPARCQLVAAMNPCPCGYLGDPGGRCHCSREQVRRYRARISGPLLDRIDLQVEMAPVSAAELLPGRSQGEASAPVRERVRCARRRQWERGRCLNAELDAAQTERYCEPDREGRRLLSHALDRFALSARAAHRVLRVARSIADLAGAPGTRSADIAEALALRTLELKRAAW